MLEMILLLNTVKNLMKKILNLKLAITSESLNICARIFKGYAPNWSEDIFAVEKIKNTVSWTYVISDLNGEKIVRSFYKK